MVYVALRHHGPRFTISLKRDAGTIFSHPGPVDYHLLGLKQTSELQA
jgi:hypothetical protein